MKPNVTAVSQQLEVDAQELKEMFRGTAREFSSRIDRMRATADDFIRRKRAERRPSRESLPVVRSGR